MRLMRGSRPWKPKPPCLIRRTFAVAAFEAGVGESEADGGEHCVATLARGAGELDERFEPTA
jgi:hypothetical protein